MLSEKRLSLTPNGNVRYQLKTQYRESLPRERSECFGYGTKHVIFEPLDFIARLAALVGTVNFTRNRSDCRQGSCQAVIPWIPIVIRQSSVTPSRCLRFCLSFRDVEDLLAERGIAVSYESIRQWCNRFGPEYARKLKKRQGRLGDTWYLDEVFFKINGELHYLWRAVDQDGDSIDILVQKRRNKAAAKRFFRKLLKSQHQPPWRMITDKLKSYSAAHREVMPSFTHCTEQYENNRAEVSHEPTRQRERQMRRFKSAGQAQRFLTVYGVVGNLFRLGRHLTRAVHYREFRSGAFCEWQAVTCAQIMA